MTQPSNEKVMVQTPTPDQRGLSEEERETIRLCRDYTKGPHAIYAPIPDEQVAEVVCGLLAIIDRLTTSHAAEGWQPIETAPSDDRYILVIGGRYDEAEIVKADGNWWRGNPHGLHCMPTHWMPLPSPPGALSTPTPDQEGLSKTISASDPKVIIAGIRQFGLAPDGADLRDLEAAISRLTTSHAAEGRSYAEGIEERIGYWEKHDLHNGWRADESGPCCEQCVLTPEHLTGHADALKARVGCRDPFQVNCGCHLLARQAIKNRMIEELTALLALSQKPTTQGGKG